MIPNPIARERFGFATPGTGTPTPPALGVPSEEVEVRAGATKDAVQAELEAMLGRAGVRTPEKKEASE